MKKTWLLVFVLAFVLASGLFAGMDKDGMDGSMMWAKADMKVENTADGVKIMVSSKDAGEVKMIQEKTAKMAEMHGKMDKGEGKMWMDHDSSKYMKKKMGIAFKFLVVIWSLLIILMSVTIILICKKIMAKQV